MAGLESGPYEYEAPETTLDTMDNTPTLSEAEKSELKEEVREKLGALEKEMENMSEKDINKAMYMLLKDKYFPGSESITNDDPNYPKFRAAQKYLKDVVSGLKEYGLKAVTFEVDEAFWDGRLTALQEKKSNYVHPEKGFKFKLEDGTEEIITLQNAIFEDFTPLRNKIMTQKVTFEDFKEATGDKVSEAEASQLWSYIMNGQDREGKIQVKTMQTIAAKLDPQLKATLDLNNGIDNAYGGWTTETMRKINLDSYIEGKVSGETEENSIGVPKETPETNNTTPGLSETPEDVNAYKEVVFFVDKSGSYRNDRPAAVAEINTVMDSYSADGGTIGYVPFKDYIKDFENGVFENAAKRGVDNKNTQAIKESLLADDLALDSPERESVLLSMKNAIKALDIQKKDDGKILFVAFFDEPDAMSDITEFQELKAMAAERNITMEIRYKDESPNNPRPKQYNINVNDIPDGIFTLAQTTIEGGGRNQLDFGKVAKLIERPNYVESEAKRYMEQLARQKFSGATNDVERNKFVRENLPVFMKEIQGK